MSDVVYYEPLGLTRDGAPVPLVCRTPPRARARGLLTIDPAALAEVCDKYGTTPEEFVAALVIGKPFAPPAPEPPSASSAP